MGSIFKLCISLLSIFTQAVYSPSHISQQLYNNLAQQNVEIVDYDDARDYETVKNILKDGWKTISVKQYSDSFVKEMLADCQSDPKMIIKVAQVNNKTVGIMIFEAHYPIRVSLLAVDSAFRNQGIGYKLLSCAQNLAHKNKAQGLVLAVHDHNTAAIQLYKKFGFLPKAHYGKRTLMIKPFNADEEYYRKSRVRFYLGNI